MITVLNILLVEDNPGDIRLLQEILREVTTTRCQITPAMTLAMAIELLTASDPTPFDAILIDLSLPDSQGIGSFLTIQRQVPNVPIVVLTGLDDEQLALSAMQQGAQDYLIKGRVDSSLLLRSIRYAIERERAETQLRQTKIEWEQRAIDRTRDLERINERLQLELAERRRVEAALEISRSRFAGILEIASDAIIACDRDRIVTLFNQAAEEIFGYSAADAIGKSLDLLLPQQLDTDDLGSESRLDPSTSCSGRGKRQQTIGVRRDGSSFPAEASISYLELGQERVYTIVLRDVTERQQAERNLHQALHKLNFHFENSPLATIEWDREFRVARWSATAEKIFGWSAAEVLGKRPDEWKFVVAEDAECGGRFAERTIAGLGDRKVAIERNYRANGKIANCEWYNSILLDDSGRRMESVFSLVLDVTERHQVERMKDEFIAIVSHELRTPLTSIYGSLTMLASGLLDPTSEKGQRLLAIAVDSTDRLMRLVNDILDIERIESGTVTMVKAIWSVGDLMAKAIDVVQPLADRAEIRLNVSNSGGQVWVDADRLIQTFTNLLSNAIKFSPPGSTVWFISTKQTGRMLFQVRDRGRGIPPEKLELIFERFQQVDVSDSRNNEGTGLGLAICRSIIQQHGGRIWVESELGVGSTFSFILPRSPSASDSVPPSRKAAIAPSPESPSDRDR